MFNVITRASLSLFLLVGWSLAHAAAVTPPTITIIIDDVGNNLANGERTVALPGAITLAVLPFTPFGNELARKAHMAGKEIMLHLPMDNSHNRPLGPGGLTFAQNHQQFQQQLENAIANTPYVSGLNNHMGSGLTSSKERMQWLMDTLKNYPLYFVDSRTTVASVAAKTAYENNIPTLERQVFLDHEITPAFIEAQFNRLIEIAQKHGSAVAIGHPYPETLSFLEEVLPNLDAFNVKLITPSEKLAITRSPQIVARKTAATTATELSVSDNNSRHESPVLAKSPAEKLAPGQCRITELLEVTRVICS